MPETQQQRQPFPPPPPTEPVQEGARWRWHRPSSEQVAAWFADQPLDADMRHSDYVGGVVLIPQIEKVKYTNPDGRGTTERHEQVFTPYVQIGTRVAYSRFLAEQRNWIRVIAPAEVPRSTNPQSHYFNANMEEGLWWHVVTGSGGAVTKFLCATWVVEFYEPLSYARRLNGQREMPVLQGRGTKQVSNWAHNGADINAIAKAQTGAIGRALGVAGILVVGTGIATAEDMQELQGQPAQAAPTGEDAQLPAPTEVPAGAPPVPQTEEEALDQLRSRAMALQTQMQESTPTAWQQFTAWWKERATESGWTKLDDVPYEALKGVVSYMERLHAEAAANAATEVAPQEEGAQQS